MQHLLLGEPGLLNSNSCKIEGKLSLHSRNEWQNGHLGLNRSSLVVLEAWIQPSKTLLLSCCLVANCCSLVDIFWSLASLCSTLPRIFTTEITAIEHGPWSESLVSETIASHQKFPTVQNKFKVQCGTRLCACVPRHHYFLKITLLYIVMYHCKCVCMLAIYVYRHYCQL